jgi:hypothetical protein
VDASRRSDALTGGGASGAAVAVTRARAARGARIGFAAVAICVALAAAVRPAQQPRYEGEHGLWVSFARDSLVVQWITQAARPGVLEVVDARGQVLARVETPADLSHRAAVRPPRGGDVLLRYGGGATGETLHETVVSLAQPRRPPVSFPAVDSLYVIGDTHGMYDELVAGLQRAGLIDHALRWTGGRHHLVLAGDLMDRGPDVTGLLWLVYRLEREAAAAGGRVHVVLGNHEIMVMLGDLRYVHPKEAEVAVLHGTPYDRMFDIRHSVLGRWLASRPAMIRIGDVVIVHGGVTEPYARLGLRRYDQTLRRYMAEELFYVWADTTAAIPIDQESYERRVDFFWGESSVFWHRGYVQSDTLDAELRRSLGALRASTLVVGHTPVDSIHTRYDGRLIPAHTRRYGEELLLLARDGNAYRRYRITASGTEPFDD